MKFIKTLAINANNMNIEQAECSGRNQCYLLWQQVSKSGVFILRVSDKFYIIMTSGIIQG
jgi:hypothetical protein